MQVREAEDAPASYARAALQQIDATSTLIAVGRELCVAEHPEFRHRWSGVGTLNGASWRCSRRAGRVGTVYPSRARATVQGTFPLPR